LVYGAHNSIVEFMINNLCFLIVSVKDLNNDFSNYVFLISFLNYIIHYFSSYFVQLHMTSQIILFNIFI
jgi:hypothetical protein